MNLQINPLDRSDTSQDEDTGRSRARHYAVGAVALALVLGGFWYLTNGHDTATRRGNLSAPVKVAMAHQRNMAVVERTIGTVVANSNVSITARVTGQLQTASFKEGDLVKKGDLLFQIDPRPYQAALDQAQGQLARDQANLANAKVDLERYQMLAQQNAISNQQLATQAALVRSDGGVVAADQATVETQSLEPIQ